MVVAVSCSLPIFGADIQVGDKSFLRKKEKNRKILTHQRAPNGWCALS